MSNSDPSRDWLYKIAEGRNCWRCFWDPVQRPDETSSGSCQGQELAAATGSARQKESNVCSRGRGLGSVIVVNSQMQKYSLTPAGPFWSQHLLTQSYTWCEDRKGQSWFCPSLFLALRSVITQYLCSHSSVSHELTSVFSTFSACYNRELQGNTGVKTQNTPGSPVQICFSLLPSSAGWAFPSFVSLCKNIYLQDPTWARPCVTPEETTALPSWDKAG